MWVHLVIFSAFLFGAQGFLYNVAMRKKLDKFTIIFYYSFVVAVLSLISVLFYGMEINAFFDSIAIKMALIYTVFHLLRTAGQMEALKYIPSGIVFAISSMGTFITVMLAVALLKETLTLIQLIGIFIIVGSISFFYYDSRGRVHQFGIIIAIASMIFSGICSFILKLSAISVNILLFMFFYSLFTTLGAGLLSGKKIFNKQSAKIGSMTGLINFIGVYMYLTALRYGPVSVIRPLVSIYVFVAAILSYIFYKERLSIVKILFILLSLFGASLLVIEI